jgi:hypothetical protein
VYEGCAEAGTYDPLFISPHIVGGCQSSCLEMVVRLCDSLHVGVTIARIAKAVTFIRDVVPILIPPDLDFRQY